MMYFIVILTFFKKSKATKFKYRKVAISYVYPEFKINLASRARWYISYVFAKFDCWGVSQSPLLCLQKVLPFATNISQFYSFAI